MFQHIAARFASFDWGSYLLLAQGEAAPKKPAAGDGDGGGLFGNLGIWAPLLIMVVLFYFMLIRPQQRERAQLQKLLDSLKKNDRVLLQSGIVGTIMNVQQGAKYVTIKIDESSNAKIKVLRSAIARVITGEDEDDEKKPDK